MESKVMLAATREGKIIDPVARALELEGRDWSRRVPTGRQAMLIDLLHEARGRMNEALAAFDKEG